MSAKEEAAIALRATIASRALTQQPERRPHHPWHSDGAVARMREERKFVQETQPSSSKRRS